MADGDLVATMVGGARNAGSGTSAVAVSRGATPDAASEAATSTTTPDAKAAAVGNDAQSARSSSASDPRAVVVDLMRAYGEAVLWFCIRVLRDQELAEEVRQQTFLEAFRDFDRFREGSSRRAWLFGIASHRCLDAIRDQQRRSRCIQNDEAAVINTHDPGVGPSEQIAHAQLTSALLECLQLLSPDVRMTVLLRFQTDLTYEELALRLSAKADALQMRVARAMQRLRACLESKGVGND